MISLRLLLKASLLAVIIFLLGSGSGIARGSGNGFDTVKRVVNIFSVWGGKEPNKNLLKELTYYIDYNEMAERSLGKYWFDLTPLDRREYAFVFRKLVEDRYYSRWRKIFSRGKIEKIKEVDTSDSLYVKTAFRLGDKEDAIVWRLSKRSRPNKIVSITVDDKDLLTRMSIRVQKQMKKNGYKKLMAWMKDRADLEDSKFESLRSTATK